MTLEDLAVRRTATRSIDGINQPVSIATARRMAAGGGIIPCVLGCAAKILDWGREKRLFTKSQRLALVERDGGLRDVRPSARHDPRAPHPLVVARSRSDRPRERGAALRVLSPSHPRQRLGHPHRRRRHSGEGVVHPSPHVDPARTPRLGGTSTLRLPGRLTAARRVALRASAASRPSASRPDTRARISGLAHGGHCSLAQTLETAPIVGYCPVSNAAPPLQQAAAARSLDGEDLRMTLHESPTPHPIELAAAAIGRCGSHRRSTHRRSGRARHHPDRSTRSNPDFGPNVKIFSPDTPLAEIQSYVDALADQQRDDEMSTQPSGRLLPARRLRHRRDAARSSRSATTPRSRVSARRPTTSTSTARSRSTTAASTNGGTSNCLALVNFWRTISNLSLDRSTRPARTDAAPAPTSGRCRRPSRCAASTSRAATCR